ncbi:hypothetical protein QWY93_17125 [Echinicola jeungdonensis]|uniref:Big-1 domain-containing protein n=1 Tax=Echinicola jeungdonensis TaxID=709343 RepID=A0ABV5J2P3_9BACT|nr:hypothetical protein [Echinicola jeungdonensis]MDN3671039.1 hypothetical protein [Echinicola jeungdonensis]
MDWDSNLKAGVDITTGVDITIFGYSKSIYSVPYRHEKVIWNAPDSLFMLSGNDQEGTQGMSLTEPLKVKVTDNLNNPLSDIPVYFNVTKGGGKVDNQSIMTDEQGVAEVLWTLGYESEDQTVDVVIKNADGLLISPSLEFNATSEGNKENFLRIGDKEYSLSDGILNEEGSLIDDDGNEFGNEIVLTLVSEGISILISDIHDYEEKPPGLRVMPDLLGSGQILYFEIASSSYTELTEGVYTPHDKRFPKANTFIFCEYTENWNEELESKEGWKIVNSGKLVVRKVDEIYELIIDCTNENGEKIIGYYKAPLKWQN